MQTPNAVVIGYGFAGRCFHSYLIGLAPGLKLHGIASRDPETRLRIEKERGCRAYASFEDVLADPEVDLVVLGTPNHAHAEQAIAALEAGKNVVTDKIMCLNLADCDRMIAAAERNQRLLMVFQNRRWDGDFLTVRSLIASGELGAVRWVEMAWQGFGPWGGWRGSRDRGGGRFFDLGAHLIDQLLVLFPEPVVQVFCRMHHDYPTSDTDSEALLVVGFEGGRTGVCDLSGMTAVSRPRFAVHGSAATFVKYGLDPQEKAMIAEEIDRAIEPEENYGRLHDGKSERVVPTLPGRWRNFYENVAEVLVRGAAPAVPLEESRRVMSVVDAALRSVQTGKAIQL